MANRRFTAEEARERKNQRQREYSKATNFASQKEYNKQHGKNINFRVFTPQDDDIIEFLETLPNKAGYMKDLIRADITRRKAAKLSRKIVALIGLKEKVYVWFESDDVCKKFQQDAEAEGFTFGDGKKPTEKETADMYAILEDKKLCYVGHIGRIAFSCRTSEIVRVDYEKF